MVKVYKCLISGDELVSDAFKILEVKDAEGNVVRDGVGAEMAKSKGMTFHGLGAVGWLTRGRCVCCGADGGR